MFCDAQSGKCKDTEKIWGIVGKGTNKLHRLTFSRGLAEFIVNKYPGYECRQFSFKVGRVLENGENSRSGLYALMSKKGEYALRISLIKGISELHCDDDTRYLAEAWLTSM
jgi:hypothetical protein